jgi:hypothetical protein
MAGYVGSARGAVKRRVFNLEPEFAQARRDHAARAQIKARKRQ